MKHVTIDQLREAAGTPERRRDLALIAEGLAYAEAFNGKRDAVSVANRERVWRRMREPRLGLVLSYPEIAAATGTTHSTVIEALARGPAASGRVECG